jgi:hypothetical protein
MKYILVLSLSVALFLVFSSALNSKKCDCEELKACNEKYINILGLYNKIELTRVAQQAESNRLSGINKALQKENDSLKLLIK